MRNLNWGMKACGGLLVWGAVALAAQTGGAPGTQGPAIALPVQTEVAVPPAPTFAVVHSFDYTDGAYPYAGLVQGTDGRLYGTTFGGGCGKGGEGEGCGTVFKMTPGGALTSLYTFCSQGGNECTDGLFPYAGLVQGADGKFYGTTSNGGGGYDDDNGTVFSITPGGKLTTLYTFCSQGGENCTDGSGPGGPLVQGVDGNFYGTTGAGGTNNYGTVFKITPSGALTTLHSFCSQGQPPKCTDGLGPVAGLVLASDGKFYGTTGGGGAYGYGIVYSITPGATLTMLYSFCSLTKCADGVQPKAGLVQGTDGNFYGTNDDTVFKITPSGELTTLYTFCTGGPPCPDGLDPEAGLVEGTDGNFYGTTESGGNNNGECGIGCGTIFRITPNGELTNLYDFCSQSKCRDGEEPYPGLVQDTNGAFYGMAFGGSDYGVVFSLSVGLRPFIETEPAFGKEGKQVKILGTDLTSATSVTFNGAAATFTVVSSSEITTTVPAGASSGRVEVRGPRGTLSSNVPFRVLP
jgi:uncharacterized repeat protein (TIGR03803 family)